MALQGTVHAVSSASAQLIMAIVCSNFEMNYGREFGSYRSSLPLERSIPASTLGQRRHAFSSGQEESSLPYSSNPRMKRRGAVSYHKTDVTALYIRFLGKLFSQPSTSVLYNYIFSWFIGDAVSKRCHFRKQEKASLLELLPSNCKEFQSQHWYRDRSWGQTITQCLPCGSDVIDLYSSFVLLIAVNLLVATRTGRRGSLRQVTAASSFRETMRNSILHPINVEMHGNLIEV